MKPVSMLMRKGLVSHSSLLSPSWTVGALAITLPYFWHSRSYISSPSHSWVTHSPKISQFPGTENKRSAASNWTKGFSSISILSSLMVIHEYLGRKYLGEIQIKSGIQSADFFQERRYYSSSIISANLMDLLLILPFLLLAEISLPITPNEKKLPILHYF